MNTQGRGYGNALQAASRNGHDEVVQILIYSGADVNAQDFMAVIHKASNGAHSVVLSQNPTTPSNFSLNP